MNKKASDKKLSGAFLLLEKKKLNVKVECTYSVWLAPVPFHFPALHPCDKRKMKGHGG